MCSAVASPAQLPSSLSSIQRPGKRLQLYANRREFFINELNKLLGEHFILQIPEAELNFVAWLRRETDFARVSRVRSKDRNQTISAIILLRPR
jgi:hypothetical protein